MRDMDEQDLDWHDLDRIAKRIMKRAGIKCRPLALQPGYPMLFSGRILYSLIGSAGGGWDVAEPCSLLRYAARSYALPSR